MSIYLNFCTYQNIFFKFCVNYAVVTRITICNTVSSDLCVMVIFGFAVISKGGAGQLDLLILDTLYRVSQFFFFQKLVIGRGTITTR